MANRFRSFSTAVDTVFSNTFQRTGQVFYAWPNAILAPPNAVPVCRFYAPSPLIDSHFYTPFASECQYVIAHDSGTWVPAGESQSS